MGFITRMSHAIDVADRFKDGLNVLYENYGDAAKWHEDASLPAEQLGAFVARFSQLVQLSFYAVELMLKVLYQQDYGKPFEGRNHRLLDIFDKLEKETKRRVNVGYAEGDVRSVLAVCDGKYNLYRYEIFEMDDPGAVDFAYDSIVKVLEALVSTAIIRVPDLLKQQYEGNIDYPASWQRPSAWPRPAAE